MTQWKRLYSLLIEDSFLIFITAPQYKLLSTSRSLWIYIERIFLCCPCDFAYYSAKYKKEKKCVCVYYVFWIYFFKREELKAYGMGIWGRKERRWRREGEGKRTQEIHLCVVRRIYGAGVEPSITRVRAKDNAVSRCHLYACPHKLILNKVPLFPPKGD